jgi:hypothetical protein
VCLSVCIGFLLLYLFAPNQFSLRRMVICLLACYRTILSFSLYFRGHTPSSAATERVVTGQVWSEFCDSIKQAGATILSPGSPLDDLNQVMVDCYRMSCGSL